MVEPLPGTSASPSFERPSTQSAAGFRHSLLPPGTQSATEVSENNSLLNISYPRMSDILNLVRCEECGRKSTWKVTPVYFDCTINISCDKCEKILLHSPPKKCKDSEYTEGNVMHVYHSLCEGYGRAGLTRLSAAMGTKEMTTYSFNNCSQFPYSEMNKFYEEQQLMTKRCVEKVYENDEH